ncbi:MAG: hypothetical protein WCJ72_14580 [Chryseobacterium sp.]
MKKYIVSIIVAVLSAYTDKDWSWQYILYSFALAFFIIHHLPLLETKKTMKTTTKIELSEKELKAILCEKFGFPENTAELDINITKGDRPGEMDEIKIVFEAEKDIIRKS